jgi:hypothetical protein
MSWLGPLQHISFDYSIKYGPFACSIQFIFKQLAFPFVGFGKHFLHLPTSSSLPSPLWALANTFSTCQLPAAYLLLCGPWQTLSPLANFQFGLQLYCHRQHRSVNEIRLVKMTDNLQYLRKSFTLVNFRVTRLISTA